MCAIAGIYNYENKAPFEISSQLNRMLGVMVYRGPDKSGVWESEDRNIAFGHNRLSVIDTSTAADQPLHFADRYTIVYNGEIYNYIELKKLLIDKGYSFKTSSDTEVILAMYDYKGKDCLSSFDGMFSFAIWDGKEKELFCAVDRFGEKPFYYAMWEGNFIFSSEMKGLWAYGLPKQVNMSMAYQYMVSGSVFNANDQVFFEGIKKLKPSHALFISRDHQISTYRYWDIDPKLVNKTISFEEAKEQFFYLLSSSIKKRLRSDVSVGACLSGGLDSSIIVAVLAGMLKEQNRSIKTFSARFEGYEKDEGQYIRKMQDRFSNIEAHSVYPNASLMVDNIDRIIHHHEGPVGSASVYVQYEVMRLAKVNSTRVLLDGQGADEMLAGYTYYYKPYMRELYLNNKTKFKEELELYKNTYPSSVRVFEKDLSFYLTTHAPKLAGSLYRQKEELKEWFTLNYFHEDFLGMHRMDYSPKKDIFVSDLNYSLYKSMTSGGLQELLVYADRNAMANSVETRLPFLSHDLVSFVFSLPSSYKMNGLHTKHVAREAFMSYVPKEIINRKDKISFAAPQESWMKDQKVMEAISSSIDHLIKEKVLNKKAKALLNKKGTDDLLWRIWMVDRLLNS